MKDKLNWYANRLRSMSISEMGHRFAQAGIVAQDRHTWKRDAGQAHTYLEIQLPDWQLPLPYIAEANVEATQQIADQLLAHKITLFGYQFELGNHINWHQDPRTKRKWPAIFYGDVDTRDGKTIGGVKWVWELNRHHHWVTLAKAYHLLGDEQYAEEMWQQFQSWQVQNPPLTGVNWTSSLELALRLINWVWAYHFVQNAEASTPHRVAQLIKLIRVQGAYILRHLSAYSSANNHLIGEVAGLAVASLAFPLLPEAPAWRRIGFSTLTAELPRQIHPDGVPAEQATEYLYFTISFYLQVWAWAQIMAQPLPTMWQDRLRLAGEFLAHLRTPNGQLPHIGDGDSAWVVRLNDDEQADIYGSLLASLAVITQEPSLKISAKWDETCEWLWGANGRQTFQDLTLPDTPLASHLFAEGGYAILRTLRHHLTFDAGPLGYLATAAHGHADALSLTWFLDEQPILVDTGTYAYQEGYEWRDYFRSTAAHNTLQLNEQDQSQMQGAFLWGKKATAKFTKWKTTQDYDMVEGWQDGYQSNGVFHRRLVILYKRACLYVVDACYGQETDFLRQLWHFPPEAHLQKREQGVGVTVGSQQLLVQCLNPHWQTNFLQGETNPIQGWVSARYGHKQPAPVLVFSGQLAPSTETVFWFENINEQEKKEILQTCRRWSKSRSD